MNTSLGQLMLIGFEGTRASKELLNFIRGEEIGGVILFRRNFESAKQLKILISELQEASDGKLIVSIDHEGGRVMRLEDHFTHFPSAARIAESGANAVYDVGLKMGRELSSVGINLNFAPVLDVATNTFNTVIGDRSYGSDPTVVADFAVEMMHGLLDGGVLPCGKHFPGHGDTDLDSHLSLPVVSHTLKRFEECEFHPFRVAVAAGVPMIMTAHLLAPNLDPKWPATISKRITNEILRKDLGFKGVIITDDLRMKGISNLMPIPDAAVKALEAGHDMVMICRIMELQRQTLDNIKRAADAGLLFGLEDKLTRIAALKGGVQKP